MPLAGTPVVEYYLDQAASGTTPTQVDDTSANTYHLTEINYGSGNMAWAEVSGNRGLEGIATTGAQRARRGMGNSGDAVRTALAGGTRYTFEIVIDPDAFNASNSRIIAINDRVGGNPTLGVTAISLTQYRVYFNGNQVSEEFNPGQTGRFVLTVVIDTNLNVDTTERVRVSVNGGTFSNLSNGVLATSETLTIPSDVDLIIGNRESSGTFDRAVDGIIFLCRLCASALTQTQVTDNYNILTLDDDAPPTFTLEQEGARFRLDDGSETTATWKANQDANATHQLDTNLRLRKLINATLDPSAQNFRLEYRRTDLTIWNPLATHVSSATLTFGVSGGMAYSAGSGGTVAPPLPSGITTKSSLILVVGQKPATANGGGVTTPTGWTLIGSLTGAGGYGATLGADTGNTNAFVYRKNTVDGTESGTLSVSLTDNNVAWAVIVRLESNVPATFSFALATGSDTSAGSVSIAMGSDPGVQAGDYILAGMVIPTDVTTPAQFSAEALSQTGITFGTVTEFEEPDSANGNDIGGFLVHAPVNSGTSSAAPTLTATAGGTTTNVRGPGFFLRVRATPYQPIELSASSNITAGGENTTAQLTPPSGKTTSDFQAGRAWDDENGVESLDLASGKYTELEWCMKALAAEGASNGQQYEFRVTRAGTALNTYSVTPVWTIGNPTTPSRTFPTRRSRLRRLFHH